jgi:hypothetical protein
VRNLQKVYNRYLTIGKIMFEEGDLTPIILTTIQSLTSVELKMSDEGRENCFLINQQSEREILFHPYEDATDAARLAGLLMAWAEIFDTEKIKVGDCSDPKIEVVK